MFGGFSSEKNEIPNSTYHSTTPSQKDPEQATTPRGMNITNTNNTIDEDLARSASQSLSLGSSIVVNFNKSTSVVLPRNLHPGLYYNSMNDVHLHHDISAGVPGFPDFPKCWQGESSSERRCVNHERKYKPDAASSNRNQRRHQRRLVRHYAVNKFGMIKSTNVIKWGSNEIKIRLREKRRLQRKEYIAKLHERVKRKQDMRAICRGLESIKCN